MALAGILDCNGCGVKENGHGERFGESICGDDGGGVIIAALGVVVVLA